MTNKTNKTNKNIIQHRKLSDQEIILLMDEIQKTVNITGYTKAEWGNFGEVYVAVVDEKLAGVCVNISISKKYSELAVLLVFEEYRGHNFGKELFKAGLEAIVAENKIAYTTTRNPIVKKFMIENNFKFLQLHKLPWAILIFNLKFILSFYRQKQFFIKKMYSPKLRPFEYGLVSTLVVL